ncbi:MAG TPA: curli production assembly protein CsgB [Pseudomonas xinjiangensis]|uniref:Curli production assembly protein CsgB n=2 Tax=root TaxID=1 RepID=A0A7V1FRB5_9GAMM|nr:curli production assembly protein CsgB [Halopseudomonas xinjiangensis]HEC49122.1 curli production assembly protein CsgB [Halopseudomonas xinjiangensis]
MRCARKIATGMMFSLLAFLLVLSSANANELASSVDLAPGELDISQQQTLSQISPRHLQGDNLAIVQQNGDHLSGAISQTGTELEAFIIQTGHLNTAAIDQDGFSNYAGIIQSGYNNQALIEQGGAYNSALIEQTGSDKSSSVTQSGRGVDVLVRQYR